ncbi:MAG TPA: hypothetical protein VFQ43_01425 [Nitrososphaera sp.]|nr:hypothetical protein [Nitrososphaera sp.]
MSRKLSSQEFHALYCPIKNTKSALFLVACFSWVTFVGWKGLHKAPEHPSFIELLFFIFAAAIYAKGLMIFKCFRERLVLGIVIASLVTDEVSGFFPAIVGPYAHLVKSVKLVLWVLCLLVSLTMFVQSARSPNVAPSNAEASITRQPKQNILILLVVTLTVLVLGAMLYFLPFRQ